MAIPPVFTVLLARALLASSGETLLYSVPAQAEIVIRDIVVANHHALPQVIQLYVQKPGFTFHLYENEVASHRTEHLEMRQKLFPGDEVRGFADLGTWAVMITGYSFIPA